MFAFFHYFYSHETNKPIDPTDSDVMAHKVNHLSTPNTVIHKCCQFTSDDALPFHNCVDAIYQT